MPHLTAVPGPDPDEAFVSIPVCPTCPAGSLGFSITRTARDWEAETWHEQPCPRTGEARTLIRVPGCTTCHTWRKTDLSVSSLIPGRWAFIPKHGQTPLTSQDRTIGTASGGEYCPKMKFDNAVINQLGGQDDG